MLGIKMSLLVAPVLGFHTQPQLTPNLSRGLAVNSPLQSLKMPNPSTRLGFGQGAQQSIREPSQPYARTTLFASKDDLNEDQGSGFLRVGSPNDRFLLQYFMTALNKNAAVIGGNRTPIESHDLDQLLDENVPELRKLNLCQRDVLMDHILGLVEGSPGANNYLLLTKKDVKTNDVMDVLTHKFGSFSESIQLNPKFMELIKSDPIIKLDEIIDFISLRVAQEVCSTPAVLSEIARTNLSSVSDSIGKACMAIIMKDPQGFSKHLFGVVNHFIKDVESTARIQGDRVQFHLQRKVMPGLENSKEFKSNMKDVQLQLRHIMRDAAIGRIDNDTKFDFIHNLDLSSYPSLNISLREKAVDAYIQFNLHALD